MVKKSTRKSKKNKRKFLRPTTAFFECEECSSQWYDYNLGDDEDKITQACIGNMCNAVVHPFRIQDRCFGNFNCKKCKKQWFSAHTYALTFQKCKECNGEVLPHKMKPLINRRRSDDKDKKAHLDSLCGMCRKLGHRCTHYPEMELINDFNNLEI